MELNLCQIQFLSEVGFQAAFRTHFWLICGSILAPEIVQNGSSLAPKMDQNEIILLYSGPLFRGSAPEALILTIYVDLRLHLGVVLS